MALDLSSGLKNGMMGTSGFNEIFASGTMGIFTGDSPGADKGATGSLLCSTGVTFTVAGGVATLNTCGLTVLETGTAGYFRLSESGDNMGVDSTSAKRLDGECGVTLSDMLLGDVVLTAGKVISIQGTFNIP